MPADPPAGSPLAIPNTGEWFDVNVVSLVREREAQFYAAMTKAFRSELQKQVGLGENVQFYEFPLLYPTSASDVHRQAQGGRVRAANGAFG